MLRQLKRAVAGADLVILEQARRNLDAYLMLSPPGRLRPSKIALWGHGRDYTRASGAVDRRLRRWLTLRSDWFFAYTRGGVDAVIGDGFRPSHVTLVQNSIDTASLSESVRLITDEQVRTFASMHDLRGKTALFIGALDESKRLPWLLEAAEKCYERDGEFRLLVAGDGELRSQMELSASEKTWLKYLGPLTGSHKALAFAAAQVLAMPGRVGLVAVDSFAAAIPIITTAWAWHAPEFEYLDNDRNAVITSDQSHAFVEALHNLLNDPALLLRLGRVCRADSELVTLSAMADNFLNGILHALRASR